MPAAGYWACYVTVENSTVTGNSRRRQRRRHRYMFSTTESGSIRVINSVVSDNIA